MIVFFDLVDNPELPLESSPLFKLGALVVDDGEAELEAGTTVSDVRVEEIVLEPLTVTTVVVVGLVVLCGVDEVTVLRVVEVDGELVVEVGVELVRSVEVGVVKVDVGVVDVCVMESEEELEDVDVGGEELDEMI